MWVTIQNDRYKNGDPEMMGRRNVKILKLFL